MQFGLIQGFILNLLIIQSRIFFVWNIYYKEIIETILLSVPCILFPKESQNHLRQVFKTKFSFYFSSHYLTNGGIIFRQKSQYWYFTCFFMVWSPESKKCVLFRLVFVNLQNKKNIETTNFIHKTSIHDSLMQGQSPKKKKNSLILS